MKILETYTMGKFNDPARCEDSIVITDDFIAVIDGVTTKSGRLYEGRKSGRVAAELLSGVIPTIDARIDAEGMMNSLSRAIAQFSKDHHSSGNEIPRASVIIYSHAYHEIWDYGDCQCRIQGKTYHHESRIDEMNGMLRQYVLETRQMEGTGIEELLANDPGRAAIQENLNSQYLFENIDDPFGYAVINGSCIQKTLIRIIPVPASEEIILASDGYLKLCDTLEETEMLLSMHNQSDPLCFKDCAMTKGVYPGQISFDDRCYVRFMNN